MDKLFPKMRECPEGKQVALGGIYWVLYKIMLPNILLLFCAGADTSESLVMWIFVAYCVINLVCSIVIFRSYLQESFWMVRMETKRFFTSILIGLIALTVLEIPFIIFEMFSEGLDWCFALPLAEPLFGIPSSGWLTLHPGIMGLAMVVLVPVSTCCLYYAVGFAVPCQERPWLGYLIVLLLAAVPAVLLYTSGVREIAEAIKYYFSVLPIHICACWVYQRTDTIWAPIALHAAANLIGIPVSLILTFAYALSLVF